MSLKRKRDGRQPHHHMSPRQRMVGRLLFLIYRAARQGNATAQYMRAKIFLAVYSQQRFVEGKDYVEGRIVHWLAHSCNQGYIPSSLLLGRLYQKTTLDGKRAVEDRLALIVEPNDEMSRYYYLFGAYEGCVEAQYQVAFIIQRTIHNTPTMDGVFWTRKAADNNHVEAQLEMGAIYLAIGGNSLQKADMWFKKALQTADAKMPAGTIEYKIAVKYSMNDVFPDVDQVNAAYWATKGARKENAEAQHMLGRMYWEGKGTFTRNLPMAQHWMEKSAAQGTHPEHDEELKKLCAEMKEEEEFVSLHATTIKKANAERPQEVKTVLLDFGVASDMVGEIMQYTLPIPTQKHLKDFIPPRPFACQKCVDGGLRYHFVEEEGFFLGEMRQQRYSKCTQCDYVIHY